MIECGDWLGRIMRRLPVMQPGTLVATSEGIGVFLGNLGGNDRIYGVMKGGRTLIEMYPA